MASVILTIPDEQVDRVRAAFAAYQGLDVAEYNVAAFKADVIDFVKARVRSHERALAVAAANIVEVDVT